jgi:hypothetical protein
VADATQKTDFGETRLLGLMMIALVFLWKAQFVLVRYFYQDDIVNLDLARRSGLGWHYVTLLSGGQLTPGLRVLAWVLARVSLYDWPVDAGVLVLLAGCAALAAFRVLRTLLGDRPVILVPLIVYLLSPIVVPELGWWWPGLRSLSLQLATFLAVDAHGRYIRAGRERDLIAATSWVTFGLLFSTNAVLLPGLLFAITGAFLMGPTSWRAGAVEALRRYSRAWRWYGVVLVCYAVVYFSAVSGNGSQKGASVTAAWKLLLTGLAGGPWRWRLAGPGGLYAVAFPPGRLIWTAIAAVVITVVLSVWARPVAWRAWFIFAACAVLGDPVPVLVICLGLAFFPLAGEALVPSARAGPGLIVRSCCLVLGAVFIAGAIWSDQVYENVTSDYSEFAAYLTNAGRAVELAAPGTNVLDLPVPGPLVSPVFGRGVYQSVVIGPLTDRLHWIDRPHGTIGRLKMFGPDGRLYPVLIDGVDSPRRSDPGLAACWPDLGRRVTVRFTRTTTSGDRTLQINYIWASAPEMVKVRYGVLARRIRLIPGLHNAYLRVRGRVRSFTIYGNVRKLCVGGAEAGVPVPL